ncbi:hypothetical protein EPUS_03836 [Endocarpon pusillum Z07020]|uniref:Protein kinase domain-containing protein n=1 Tax=Endocarpon pusillum (strain Z07020 / HMAS-L-300199) TaxID=1263415 RepID=U1GPX2_ENDPU|nr:uncharacterized protein EPUS_03836 [Endocarpon pusillum Z07020]ERF74021.1 hypothetical protein EPUS_03836 [Endocarpon pusillum Z07020]
MAKEVGTKRFLAVKVFDRPASPAEDMRRRQAIKHELKILDAVRNGPHIIVTGTARYLDDLSRSVELPMQFYPEHLASLLERTKTERGLRDAFFIVPLYYYTVLAQMLSALVFLHSQDVNIIHRDIKPENILIEHPNGNPTDTPNHFVLGHFGCASRASPPPSGLTDSLQFIAPEMYYGQKQTAAVDIWSLGMVCVEMAGWLPGTAGATTVEAMKRVNWCNCMQELGKEIQNYRPEIEEMLRVDVLKRTTATQLLTKINSSMHIVSQKASARLARLMIKKNMGPGVPEYDLDTLVDVYLERHDLVDEDEPANTTSEVSSRTQRAVITNKPRSTPPQLPPCLQLRGGARPSRGQPLTSAPATRPLTRSRRMMGPLRSAVLPPSLPSRRIAAPTNSDAISLPPLSQGVADSSAVAPIRKDSETEGGSATTVAPPQRSRSQEEGKASEVIATPKRTLRKGAAKKSSVSRRPAQTYPDDGPSTTAKTSCESQATIEPADATLKSRKIQSQQAKEPPRPNAAQISSPAQEAERLPKSVATQESSTPERERGAAKASVSTGPQGTTTPSPSASSINLEVENPKNQRQATRQRRYSTAPQASSAAQLQSNTLRAAPQTNDTSKSTNSPRSTSSSAATSATHSKGQSSSGPRNPSQRLSADAPSFFPPGRSGYDRDQALHVNGSQPSRRSDDQCQETGVGAGLVAHQASGQATQGGVQSGRHGVMLSAHQGPQRSPALDVAGTSPPMAPLNRAIRSSPSLGQPAMPLPTQSIGPELQTQPNHTQASPHRPHRPPPLLHSATQAFPFWTPAGVYTDISPTLVGAPARSFLVYAQLGECTPPAYVPQVQQSYVGPPFQSSPSQYYFYSQPNGRGAPPYSEVPSSQAPRHEAGQGQGNVDQGGQFPSGLAGVQGQSTGAQARPSHPLDMQPQNRGAGEPFTSRHFETRSQQERVPEAVSSPRLPALPVQRDSAPGQLPSPPNTEAHTQQDRSPQKLPSALDSVAHSQSNKDEDEGEWEEPRHVRRRRSRKAIKGSA